MISNPAHDKARSRAQAAAIAKHKNSEAVVDKSAFPKAVGKHGTKVRISRGDITNDAGTQLESSVSGEIGRVDGRPYVAAAGPNKGKVIQPVTIEGTNTLVGVPTDRLSPADCVGHSRPSVGWSPSYEKAWENIFGKRKRA